MPETRFTIGDTVTDTTTGYTGTVTAYAKYEDGDTTYRIETMDDTGRPCAEWVQEYRLEVAKK